MTRKKGKKPGPAGAGDDAAAAAPEDDGFQVQQGKKKGKQQKAAEPQPGSSGSSSQQSRPTTSGSEQSKASSGGAAQQPKKQQQQKQDPQQQRQPFQHKNQPPQQQQQQAPSGFPAWGQPPPQQQQQAPAAWGQAKQQAPQQQQLAPQQQQQAPARGQPQQQQAPARGPSQQQQAPARGPPQQPAPQQQQQVPVGFPPHQGAPPAGWGRPQPAQQQQPPPGMYQQVPAQQIQGVGLPPGYIHPQQQQPGMMRPQQYYGLPQGMPQPMPMHPQQPLQHPMGPPAGYAHPQQQFAGGLPIQQLQQQPMAGPPGNIHPQQPPMEGPPGYAPQQQEQAMGGPKQQRKQPPRQQQKPQPQRGAGGGGEPEGYGPPLQQVHAAPPPSTQVPGSGDAPQQGPGGKKKGKGGKGEPQKPAADIGAVTKQTAQLKTSEGEELKPMQLIRFKPGTKGRVIKVETNHLALNLGNLKTAIHYDVALDPDRPKKFLRPVMELFRQKYYPNRYPAFDGRKNLYSSNLLPFGTSMSGEVTIQDSEGREKLYKVEVKFATEVDLSPLRNYDLSRATPREALQVVDIVLRSAPATSLISVGQSFFSRPEQIIDLGEGMEMYQGFYQSTIRGWKPFLNVDVAHKAFPKTMNATDALIDVLTSRFKAFTRDDLTKVLDRRDVDTFDKYIKTLRVTYEIPGIPSSKRGYRVNGLAEPAATKTFQQDNGTKLTIANYFQTQKRYKLRYPNLPTLWVGDKQRPNPILLPMELCTIEAGQVLNRKMTENQTATMIKSSATNTDRRKQKIETGVRKANYNASATVREFGFSVASSFEKLDARVLQPPMLEYCNKRQIAPSRGVWRGEKFFLGATISKWTIAVADRRAPRPDELKGLAEELYRQAGSNGLFMETKAEQPFVTMGSTQNEIKSYFQKQKGKFDVIFVIVPNSGQQYSYVKTAAEINVGCLTQCIKFRTLSRINVQTAVNILLKVNAKLNGTNHFLASRPAILNRPTMIMGADVTHPSPDSKDIPSVAAVTASYDPKAFKYNICWRLQPPKQELIDDLENITYEQLMYFYKVNKGQRPERIIVFRDGVSEGFFEEIRRAEIRAIRAACKKLQATDYEPSITFLVVQKRHHTRLFPLNPRDSEDRNNNVPAGTCVDTQITHPFMQDFYLVSHASIQGVAKPTKYCTLWDDNNLSNDDIEELTYFLCHMFTRCNRSVSYPAPTYYAHLAAARAKVYIENERVDLDNLQREYNRFQILDTIRKDKPMFFV